MPGLGGGYSSDAPTSSNKGKAILVGALAKRRAISEKSLFREMIVTTLGSLDTAQQTAVQSNFKDRF